MGTKPPDPREPGNEFFQQFCSDRGNAARKIYEQSFGMIRKLVRNNKGHTADARDVFQDIMLALLKYCQQSNFVLTTPLNGLIYSIGKKIWLKKLEKNGKSGITFQDLEEYVNMEVPIRLKEEALLYGHRKGLVQKYMAQLPEKAQRVLRLYYLFGYSHREIAEKEGFKDELSARVQKSRYLQRLRDLMRDDPDFE